MSEREERTERAARRCAPTWRIGALAVALLGLVAPFAAACQVIANIQEHTADPIVAGCTLPTTGDAKLRIANMAAGAPPVDVCLRPTGGDYHRAVLGGAGADCPAGVPFKSVTVPFAAASGTFDARVVAAGAPCSAPAIAEASKLTIVSGTTSTFVLAGAGASATATLLPEKPTPLVSGAQAIRFVDAVAGSPSLFFGIAAASTLPTQMTSVITSAPLGGVPAATPPGSPTALGAIDASGYLSTGSAAAITYGAALSGSTDAILAVEPTSGSNVYTLFAAGDVRDTRYPVRAVLCDDRAPADSSGVFVPCVQSNPPSISVATFNAALYGAYAPSWQLRHDTELETLAQAPGVDVLCISEIASRADQQALVALAAKTFPYAATFVTTLDTPIDDPTDATGKTQPAPTQAPCADPSLAPQIGSVLNCFTQSCQDSATGALKLSDPACMNERCTGPLASLANRGPGCFDCIIAGAASYEPFAHVRDECATNPKAGYAFEGQTPTMILSRFPLKNVSNYVLPSFMYRRSVLRAELDLDTPVDVYCAQLTYIQGSIPPYAGQWGAGPPDPSGGWADEQDLQASKLVSFVQARSSGRPAIVLGEFASSSQYPSTVPDGGTVLIAATNPSAIGQLQSAFVEAIADGFTPRCTACPPPENPLNGSETSSWSNRVFTYNFPPNAAVSSSVLFADPVVPVPDNGPSLPISDASAYAVRLLRPK